MKYTDSPEKFAKSYDISQINRMIEIHDELLMITQDDKDEQYGQTRPDLDKALEI